MEQVKNDFNSEKGFFSQHVRHNISLSLLACARVALNNMYFQWKNLQQVTLCEREGGGSHQRVHRHLSLFL